MGAADRILRSERESLPPGPWHVESYGVGTVAPTAYVRAGGLTVCSLTGRHADAVARVIARLPDLLRDTDSHREVVTGMERMVEARSDERDDLKDEVTSLKDEVATLEADLKASKAEANRLYLQLVEVRSTQ